MKRAWMWLTQASLRQWWCGLMHGHTWKHIPMEWGGNCFPAPGLRHVVKETWHGWYCERCHFEFFACEVEEAAVAAG